MGIIRLENIRVFANHGCLAEETKIGSDYSVDLEIKANLLTSASTDKLSDTVDYVLLNRIIKDEMSIPSALLETVAKRIIDSVLTDAPMVEKVTVSVRKINPPIGGDVEM